MRLAALQTGGAAAPPPAYANGGHSAPYPAGANPYAPPYAPQAPPPAHAGYPAAYPAPAYPPHAHTPPPQQTYTPLPQAYYAPPQVQSHTSCASKGFSKFTSLLHGHWLHNINAHAKSIYDMISHCICRRTLHLPHIMRRRSSNATACRRRVTTRPRTASTASRSATGQPRGRLTPASLADMRVRAALQWGWLCHGICTDSLQLEASMCVFELSWSAAHSCPSAQRGKV